jgi:hypothetical protein
VPIANVSEFEAVIGQALIKIEKAMYQTGETPQLRESRRDLGKLEEVARDPAKVKAMRARVVEIAETLRVQMSRDEDLHNDMWDVLDFIDYCM